MCRALCVLLLLVAVCSPAALIRASGYRSAHTSHRESSGWVKPVCSHGYVRKNGTYVAPYERRPSRNAGYRRNLPRASFHVSTRSRTAYRSSRSSYLTATPLARPGLSRNFEGRIKRSTASKDAFKRQQPCPSTGRSSGPCPGYVIDHAKPLECSGADAASNMQWQTIAAGKAKDKTERYCR